MGRFAALILATSCSAAVSLAPPLIQVLAGGSKASLPPKGDRELGAHLSGECVTCHQVSGRYDGIPPIISWPEEVFVAIMNEYKSHTRENIVMRTLAAKLRAEEIAALAAYFESLPEPPAKP